MQESENEKTFLLEIGKQESSLSEWTAVLNPSFRLLQTQKKKVGEKKMFLNQANILLLIILS